MVDFVAVTVIYASEHDQAAIRLNVSPGTDIRTVIERSRIQHRFPEIDLAVNKVGVYGQLRELTDIVRDGDRVEIYRPLKVDPKHARRARAAES